MIGSEINKFWYDSKHEESVELAIKGKQADVFPFNVHNVSVDHSVDSDHYNNFNYSDYHIVFG